MRNINKFTLIAGIAITMLSSCTAQKSNENLTESGLNPAKFDTIIDGTKAVKLYTLKNENGMEVCVTNFGGRIVSIMVPDKAGKMQDVVLGFDNVADYINVPSDFGASIGRYANRINKGIIVIDNDSIQLPKNNFGHCLHGGPKGWQYQVYEAKQINDQTLELTMNSADGDQNFPGNVVAKVTYKLTPDNSIDISYSATTDKKTVINMTNHSYFNLSGDASTLSTDNKLFVNSDSITPIDSTCMTSGEMMAVKNTPFDFFTERVISEKIGDTTCEQIKNGNGYDHNWVLKDKGNINVVAAKLTSPKSGITLQVYTNEPGIQVYTGNFLDGTVKGKKGIVYQQRAAVCLETQHYPDSPNKPQWPSVILEPGKTYTSHCIYKFSVEK